MKRLAFALLFVPAIALADKSFTAEKSATWDCAKDASITITHGNGKYTFKGACKDITLDGGHNTLTIETVTTLTVNGSSNTITSNSLDTVTVTGSDNKVTWKKSGGAGGKASVTTLGQNNALNAGK
ncbi:MAG: DUF3060 domain-containing protein [Kofleriaceae bacterium]